MIVLNERYFSLTNNEQQLLVYLLQTSSKLSSRGALSELEDELHFDVRSTMVSLATQGWILIKRAKKGSYSITLNGAYAGYMKDEDYVLNVTGKLASIEARRLAFGKKLIPYVDVYGKEMVRKFFNYWSESNENGRKMRFEMQKTFNIKMRLRTWRDNAYERTYKTRCNGVSASGKPFE